MSVSKKYLYSNKRHLTCDSKEVLTQLIQALMGLGFKIEYSSPTTAEISGEGLRSTKQNPIKGATKIRLDAEERQITMEAELGGAYWLSRFAFFMIGMLPVLLLSIQTLIYILAELEFPYINWIFASGLLFFPITALIAHPFISSYLVDRSRFALDELMESSVHLARRQLQMS